MPANYLVRFNRQPPFEVRAGRDSWRIVFERYGKGGKRAALLAYCSDGRKITILDGRESATVHQLCAIETRPDDPLHAVWVALATAGPIQLEPCGTNPVAALPPGCDRWLAADGMRIPLRKGYRPRDAAEVARLVSAYKQRNG